MVKDVIVIGGGQAGLSVAYFLRRTQLDYLVLDDRDTAGGAWLNTWDSLRLFSPVQYSSLSGWMMPKGPDEYPPKDEFIAYLDAYEKRYQFPIQRPVHIQQVEKTAEGLFAITTDKGMFYSKVLVSATGTSTTPHIPNYPNQNRFTGQQLHSVDYRNANDLTGKNVLVVGGGNSGAQIMAEVSKTAYAIWVTPKEPAFLPDEIDGRYIFKVANQKFFATRGKQETPNGEVPISLGSIVMTADVKEARERNVLHAVRPFQGFYEKGVIWPDGTRDEIDTVIWCTGFKANLSHLEKLNIFENGQLITNGTRSAREPNLWLVGYGNWTGFASATIYGVGKTARTTVAEIKAELAPKN